MQGLILALVGALYSYDYIAKLLSIFHPGVNDNAVLFVIVFGNLLQALLQVPAGAFLDRYPHMTVIPISMLLISTGTYISSLGGTLFIVGRMVVAIASSIVLSSCIKFTKIYFNNRDMNLVPAIVLAVGYISAGLVLKINNSYSVDMKNWIAYFSFTGLLISILILMLIRRYDLSPERDYSYRGSVIRKVFKNKQHWVFFCYLTLTSGFVTVFMDRFAIKFLQSRPELPSFAHGVLCYTYFAMAFGGFVMNHFSNTLKNRKYVITCCSFISATLFGAIMFIPMNSIAFMLTLFITSFLLSAQSLVLVCMKEISNRNSIATSTGFLTIAFPLSSAIFYPIVNYLLKTIEIAYRYQLAMIVILIAMMIGVCLLALFGEETYVESK